MKTAREDLFLKTTSLQYENKALRQELEAFRTGKRYRKMQEDYHRLMAGYVKEINKLKKELADAHARTVSVREIWFQECCEGWEQYQSAMKKKDLEIERLESEKWRLLKETDERDARTRAAYEEKLSEKDAVIEALKAELAHAQALLDRDSTNTGTPTGQTPPGKKKHIPNTRRSTGKAKGGQPGHERHVLETPSEDEVSSGARDRPCRIFCALAMRR